MAYSTYRLNEQLSKFETRLAKEEAGSDTELRDMIEELDAVVAHLYDLSEDHLTHIFETFHVGWDYHIRLESTLKHYQHWSAKK